MNYKKLTLFTLVCSMVVVAGCSQKTTEPTDTDGTNEPAAEVVAADTVSNGKVIKVDYVGRLQEDNSVFDTSREQVAKDNELYNELRTYSPLEFTVGAGQMIPGFDKGVVGMKVGEKKSIVIPATEGYGERREDLIQDLPLSGFESAGLVPEVGQTYNFGVAQGTILEIGEENVKIDFNHFLAGKTLVFEVEIVEVN